MKRTKHTWLSTTVTIAAAIILPAITPTIAQAQRLLGIDVAAWQENIAVTNWATLKRATNEQVDGVFGDGRDFVFPRSSRGGTTGIDTRQGGFPAGQNTYYELSQRYDDPYFVQNITRATDAGMLAGPYHFARLDVVGSTTRSGGIPNNGTDEANHFLQMAGGWMRPGYLLPVFDLESGKDDRTENEVAIFCIEFSDRINAVAGVRPVMYINGAYSDYIRDSSIPYAVVNAFPVLWIARYANQTNVPSIPVQTGHPKDTFAGFYGPWDDAPRPTHPWNFWQYASTARLNGYKNATASIDVNVIQGGREFLKDHLVPALWMNNNSGSWTTLDNWNSGQAPVAPVQGTNQTARVGPLTLPATRLPGSNDTVILVRTNADITVTLTGGTHNLRKLYVQETLNITGGSLTVNYVPSSDSTPISAQFSRPVALTNDALLSVHTLQVDGSNTFTLGGGTLAANNVQLMPNSTVPARLVVNGNVNLSGLSNGVSTITNGTGTGISGNIDMGGGTRTLSVPAGHDVNLSAPIFNGGLTKSGAGTLRLNRPNGYSGPTTVESGILFVNNVTGSGTGSGTVAVNGGTLSGSGTIQGAMTVASGGTVSPGTAPLTPLRNLTLNAPPTLGGTTFMEINRNGGSPQSDKITLTAGTLNYGGTLVVSNTGVALVGGEIFTLFSASGYSGSFTTLNLPALSAGLNWYLGHLTVNGTIKVNRQPAANLVLLTNTGGVSFEIPISSLTGNVTDPDSDSISLSSVSVTTNGVTMTTNGAFLSYTLNTYGADEFTYTITDGRGGFAAGTARISPFAGGSFRGVPTINGGSVTIHLAGQPSSTSYLERSTNFVQWETISTNVLPSSGVLDFVDPSPTPAAPSEVYYRLRY